MYTDRINWIYCHRDEKNRFRDPEGYEDSFSDAVQHDDLSVEYFIDMNDTRHRQNSKKRLGI